MVGSTILQDAYNKLYVQLRKYIWSFEAVNAIADLEIECYKSFADLLSVKRHLDNLSLFARDLFKDDEDLKKAFDAIYDIIENEEETYVKLLAVKEEVPSA